MESVLSGDKSGSRWRANRIGIVSIENNTIPSQLSRDIYYEKSRYRLHGSRIRVSITYLVDIGSWGPLVAFGVTQIGATLKKALASYLMTRQKVVQHVLLVCIENLEFILHLNLEYGTYLERVSSNEVKLTKSSAMKIRMLGFCGVVG